MIEISCSFLQRVKKENRDQIGRAEAEASASKLFQKRPGTIVKCFKNINSSID